MQVAIYPLCKHLSKPHNTTKITAATTTTTTATTSPWPNLCKGLKRHHVELVLRGHLVLGRGVDSPYLTRKLACTVDLGSDSRGPTSMFLSVRSCSSSALLTIALASSSSICRQSVGLGGHACTHTDILAHAYIRGRVRHLSCICRTPYTPENPYPNILTHATGTRKCSQ